MSHPPESLAATEDLLFAEALIAAEHAAAANKPRKPATHAALPAPSKDMLPAENDSPADVILRIRSWYIQRIALGIRNHEYRAYLLHSDVQYVWLWEDEDDVVRFIITIGAVARPGEVNDPSGEGNEAFDAGRTKTAYGYPIYEVYRLPCDLTRKVLLEEYGMDMANGRQYVKKALVDAFPLDTLDRVLPIEESVEDEVD